jgi:glycosyltransferase involved in cell wall biosynthesis
MRFCTVVTFDTLPHARVLADAVAQHHPGAALHALALDGSVANWSDVPFDVVLPSDLRLAGSACAASHSSEDLSMLLRPALLAHVREDGADGDAVCFMTADHDVLAPLTSAMDVGLVRRADDELPDDSFAPGPDDLAARGWYTMDFLIVGPGARARDFLVWLAGRMASLQPRLASSQPIAARAAARRRLHRLLTLAPALFAIEPLHDPGLEASAWNLHTRPLTREAGSVLACRRPLRTVHFESFDPRRPHWLSGDADRVRVVEDPVLGSLCADYASRLLVHGWRHLDRRREIGRRLPNGLVFDARMLDLYVEAMAQGAILGEIFTAQGCAVFMEWMRGPASAGSEAGINRYLHKVWADRPDLAAAYPDLDGPAGDGFARWTWDYGREELSIPYEFLPPAPPGVAPGSLSPPPLAVNVAGFFTRTLGLGEAARLYVKALDAANVPVTTTTVEVDRPVRDVDRRLGKDYGKLVFTDLQAAEECAFNLICVNADELPRFVADAGPDFFANRSSIGVWAWETDVVPERWDRSYANLDEIWVYSRYVAENLGRASPIPVVCVPPPVLPPDAGGASSGIELPEGFVFMFMFDFFSTPARKNPAGVIEAFKRAFAPGEGPQLLIKTIHAGGRPEAFDELRHIASGRPDVHVVDRALSSAAKNALMVECDCYVSLHRSEGYGLPLAECMALGKPVIGTAYSGNLDFMSPANSYLVDHAMTVVGHDVEIYPPEGIWAEPDLAHAAALMRRVYTNPEEAAARGARARRDIAEFLAPERVGQIARNRLQRLARFRAGR